MGSQKGVFIAIEGSDGSGKGTQFELLVERLRRQGYDVVTFDFPQYAEPSSYFVREYLNGKYGSAEQVGPYTAALFYALDRYQVATQITNAVSKGQVVIANRFTASSMAHQGAKFVNAEERRGYYIWLDNLEAVMLKIPRPDRSIVLRVPAETAQKLIDKKAPRNYTENKRDIHEADIQQLRHATDIYDELCTLFPKDFTPIDCVVDGVLLEPSAINDTLWGTILPLLPAVQRTEKLQPEPAVVTHIKKTISSNQGQTATKEKITPLLLTLKSGSSGTIPDPVRYFTPGNLPPKLHGAYRETMEELLKQYNSTTAMLAEFLEASNSLALPIALQKARVITRAILPLSTLVAVQSGHTIPQDVSTLTTSHQAADPLRKIANDFLDNTHAALKLEPALVAVWPRNELELLPYILYEYGNSTLASIQETVQSWPIARKQDVLMHYVSRHLYDLTSPLRTVRYTWDIVADYETIMQAFGAGCTAVGQEYTPRLGYEVPALIEEAGLSEQFEHCFMQSLQLHSTLHAAGFTAEAQYATLLGHRQRYRLTTTATQLNALRSVRSDTIQTLRQKVTELHPLLHTYPAPTDEVAKTI